MPSLSTDIVGRVERLPLRPSADNSLMPLFEAVHNALHAVDDRFKDNSPTEGRIKVTVQRADFADEKSAVTGFVIEDNGIGLDKDNYNSFLRPDSRHKAGRGGKGIGRLGWLKVFAIIEVDSTYEQDGILLHRSFDFRLTDEEQVVPCAPRPATPAMTGTSITLRDYKGSFIGRCPTDPEVILQKLASHFLLYVIADKPVTIQVEDGSKIIKLADFYAEHIRSSDLDTPTLVLETEPEPQEFVIRHLRVAKKFRPPKGYNRLLMFGNDRAADEAGLDAAMGLMMLAGDEVYIGCAASPYLDRHVNSERTGFTLSTEELGAIRRQLLPYVTKFLRDQVDKVAEEKRRTAVALIQAYPQFMFIQDDIESFITELKPGVKRTEDVFLEMARKRYRRQGTVNRLEGEIKKGAMSAQIEASIQAYQGMISVDQKGVLAEYVMRRKAVLDLFDHLREYEDPEKERSHREAALHSLICPMETDSRKLEFEDHNLWMVDDRLAFFAYFASDKRLKAYVDSSSIERPDIAFFYDTCFAWRGEGEASNTIVLVEFKRPNRDDYTGNDNPVRQIGDYVRYLQTSNNIVDAMGKKGFLAILGGL